jgi:hypothetical protein
MRKALIVAGAMIAMGTAIAPSELNAGCRGCSAAYPYGGSSYYYAPGSSYAPVQGCYWRKVRHWDWDGQYWLVSRVQVCG